MDGDFVDLDFELYVINLKRKRALLESSLSAIRLILNYNLRVGFSRLFLFIGQADGFKNSFRVILKMQVPFNKISFSHYS